MKLSMIAVVNIVAILAFGAAAQASEQLIGVSTTASDPVVTLTSGILSGANIPVNITLYAPNSFGAGSATGEFSFAATTTPGTAFGPIFGYLYGVAVTDLSFSILDNNDNLIFSGSANSASLLGSSSGYSLSGQNATDNNGITFTSPYFTLGDPIDFSLQILIGPPSVDPTISADGNLNDFSACLTPATFVGTTPEPATLSLLVLGGLAVLRRENNK